MVDIFFHILDLSVYNYNYVGENNFRDIQAYNKNKAGNISYQF